MAKNFTRVLLRKQLQGLKIVCSMEPYRGHAVYYRPRTKPDPLPWVLANPEGDLAAYRYSGRECHAVKQIFSIQTAEIIDGIFDDGTTRGQMPYPIVADGRGLVQFQDLWKGDPYRVVGLQKDLAKHRIDLWWEDAVKDPEKAVGMYLVTSTTEGKWGVRITAVTSVTTMDVGEDS